MASSRARSYRSVRLLLSGPALVAGLLGVAAIMTPNVYADGVDGHFLSALQAHQINFASPGAAIAAGHQVCDELDAGRQKSDVANDVAGSSNLDGYHAGYFVGLSIAAYCPRHHAAG